MEPTIAAEAAAKLAENLGTTALAVGALGTAAYGIVDGLKFCSWIDLAGFERLFSGGGKAGGRMWPIKHRATLDPLLPALKVAYGSDVMDLLKSQYRGGRAKGDLPRTLRQGVRIGFSMMESEKIVSAAVGLGLTKDIATLAADTIKRGLEQPPALGEEPKPEATVTAEQRSALARLETAIDARIDADLAMADVEYVTQAKIWAMIVSIGIALWVGWLLNQSWAASLVVGITAVPLAPVAKDLATALQSAAKALGAR
jgi:hypothetical protein